VRCASTPIRTISIRPTGRLQGQNKINTHRSLLLPLDVGASAICRHVTCDLRGRFLFLSFHHRRHKVLNRETFGKRFSGVDFGHGHHSTAVTVLLSRRPPRGTEHSTHFKILDRRIEYCWNILGSCRFRWSALQERSRTHRSSPGQPPAPSANSTSSSAFCCIRTTQACLPPSCIYIIAYRRTGLTSWSAKGSGLPKESLREKQNPTIVEQPPRQKILVPFHWWCRTTRQAGARSNRSRAERTLLFATTNSKQHLQPLT